MIKFEIEDKVISIEVPHGTSDDDFATFMKELRRLYGLDKYTYYVQKKFDLFETLSQNLKP